MCGNVGWGGLAGRGEQGAATENGEDTNPRHTCVVGEHGAWARGWGHFLAFGTTLLLLFYSFTLWTPLCSVILATCIVCRGNCTCMKRIPHVCSSTPPYSRPQCSVVLARCVCVCVCVRVRANGYLYLRENSLLMCEGGVVDVVCM